MRLCVMLAIIMHAIRAMTEWLLRSSKFVADYTKASRISESRKARCTFRWLLDYTVGSHFVLTS